MPDEPVPHFEGYLFDLDGTLVDTAPDLGLALNETLNRNGFRSFQMKSFETALDEEQCSNKRLPKSRGMALKV